MLLPTTILLRSSQDGGYAVGAFNVYNLEGARAVVAAAEAVSSPAILQVHPGALEHGGAPLVALCLSAARESLVPIAVHLDHSRSQDDVQAALDAGITSIMVDGSHLPYQDNVAFTRCVAGLVHKQGGVVEGELGRLTGTEDDLTVPENQAKLTDPQQAADFIGETGVDALAVCIGNVHGPYPGKPHLDFERLTAIRTAVSAPLVLHGASGLPEPMVRRAVDLGVCKFNVNTEVRKAYVDALVGQWGSAGPPDLLPLMESVVKAMQEVVSAKLRLFGSVDMADGVVSAFVNSS